MRTPVRLETTVGTEVVIEKVVVIDVAVDPEIPERRVGHDTDNEARRELIVEAALDDADDVAIARLVEVAMEVGIFERHRSPSSSSTAALVIEAEIGPADTATGAEIEACPARHRLRRWNVCCKGYRAGEASARAAIEPTKVRRMRDPLC